MNLAGFVQTWIKPSRWWRRSRTIQVTIWPKFIAQSLCPHVHKNPIMWGMTGDKQNTVTYLCVDCHKRIKEVNECAHGEVSLSAWEDLNGQKIPHSFRCEHCGQPLAPSQLPKDSTVVPNLAEIKELEK